MFSRPREILIAANPFALLDVAFSGYRLHQVVARSVAGGEGAGALLLEGRERIGGGLT